MPTDMPAAEFKAWRDRLSFAKAVWAHKGLLGKRDSDGGDGGYYGRASNMRIMLEYYRGFKGGAFDEAHLGVGEQFYRSANKIFPIANGIEGDITSRNPKMELRPRKREAIKMAPGVESLQNYDIVEQNHKRQFQRSFQHHLFAPAGFMRHGFTPSEEYEVHKQERSRRMQLYRPARPDRPWIRAVPIWNLLMDPTKEGLHVDDGVWWVAFRTIEHIDDIRDNPNMIARDGIEDFAGNVMPEWSEIMPEYLRKTSDPDANKHVEVWTVYESKERTWHQMTLDGPEKPLRNRDDWPINWETLPVNVFAVNEQMDTPFPLSILDQLGETQEEMNLLRTMIGQLVFRLRRLIGVNKAALDDDQEIEKIRDGAINEIILTQGPPRDIIDSISSGVFPQELLQYDEKLESDMRERIGQSKPGRGQRINVESATEAANVQQGQDTHLARINDAYEDFVRDTEKLYMQGRRETMAITGEELIPIVGALDADGMQQWTTVTPEDLHGEYDFTVVPGSMRKRDQQREAQLAQLDLQQALTSPDLFNVAFFAIRYLEARGIDPVRGMTEEALTASKVRMLDEVRRQAAPGGEAPAGGGVRPEVALAASNAAGSRGMPQ